MAGFGRDKLHQGLFSVDSRSVTFYRCLVGPVDSKSMPVDSGLVTPRSIVANLGGL